MVGKIGLYPNTNSGMVRKLTSASAGAISSSMPMIPEQIHPANAGAGIEPHKLAIGGLIALGVGAAVALVTRKIKSTKALTEFKGKISKIYDEGWERLVAETGEYVGSMKKPELDFSMPNTTINVASARYNSSENKIHINLDFFKKHNCFVYTESGGKIKIPAKNEVLFSKEEISQMRADGLIDETFKVKKVTQEEMLLAIQTSLAHEQRHAVQLHTALNDSTLGPEKMIGILVKDIMKKNRGMTAEKAMEQAMREAPYWVNYDKRGSLPNRALVTKIPYNDTSLKLSGKTIADSLEAYTGSVANDAYRLNLLELDANAWANHCLSQINAAPVGCSIEFLACLKLATSHIEQQTKDFLSRATLI